MEVATALGVTPAQATRASNSMSPEHGWVPSPPVAGCRPASASAVAVRTRQATPTPFSSPSAFRVTTEVLGSSRYRALSGVRGSFSLAVSIVRASM